MEDITKELQDVKMVIENAKKTNEPTLLLEKENLRKYVLSKYNPREGINKLVKLEKVNKETLWLVIGFVFGYIVDEIITHVGKEAKIIIIEPNPQFLEEQINEIGRDKIASLPNVSMFTGEDWDALEEQYKVKIQVENYYNSNVVIAPCYEEFYLKYCKEAIRRITDIRNSDIINYNTINVLSYISIENVLKNRKHVECSYDIRQHKNKYVNTPAVIVSAGPSLSKNIAFIKEFNGIIFTGGRTVKAVEDNGAKPDFMSIIDPNDIMYETFMGRAESDIPLITIPEACHKVVKAGYGPQYFVDAIEKLGQRLLNIDLENVALGGSVATLCLSTAYYMGCSPIVFIGQDLAFTDMKTHSDECNALGQSINQEEKRGFVKIKAYDEGEVLSDASYITFLKWIERFIDNNDDRIYINATEGGAQIAGTIQKTFGEVIKEYKDLEKPIIYHQKGSDEKRKNNDIRQALKENLLEIKEINHLAIKGERLSRKLQNEYSIYKGIRETRIADIVTRLEKEVDKKIEEMLTASAIGSLFMSKYNAVKRDPKYYEPLVETEIQKGLRISQASLKLYETLKTSTLEMMELIEGIED